MLRLLGFDHTRLTCRYAGRYLCLIHVHGTVCAEADCVNQNLEQENLLCGLAKG
jgi:hypothetical protein